jgi:hypothetical protein
MTAIHQTWWLVSLVLIVPAARYLVPSLLHGVSPLDPWLLFVVTLALSGVALFWWRASRFRKAFARGTEVQARITHVDRFVDRAPWGETTARRELGGLAGLIDRPTILRPSTMLGVAYPSEGGECHEQFLLDDEAVSRLRPSIGATVVLIVDPELPQPLLRDVYLDP